MNPKIKVLIAALILTATSACEKEEECKGEPINDALCYMIYDPVCGCDGKTYGNDCEARVAGIKSWTEGACGGVEDE